MIVYPCIDKGHRARLTSMLLDDGTDAGDIERISLFYIISGNGHLYNQRSSFYDFRKRCIKPRMAGPGAKLSSGMLALVKLGFNLYNGYRCEHMTPLDLFWDLDDANRRLAANAIRIRFESRTCLDWQDISE